MVEALTCKVTAWEKETGTEFSYDGVSTLLILPLLWADVSYSFTLHTFVLLSRYDLFLCLKITAT